MAKTAEDSHLHLKIKCPSEQNLSQMQTAIISVADETVQTFTSEI